MSNLIDLSQFRDAEFNRFAWLNAWVDSDLSKTHKLVLLGLFRHLDEEGQCYPSVKRVADNASVARGTARRKLKELVELGWIHRERKEPENPESVWLYTASHPDPDPPSQDRPPSEDRGDPPSEDRGNSTVLEQTTSAPPPPSSPSLPQERTNLQASGASGARRPESPEPDVLERIDARAREVAPEYGIDPDDMKPLPKSRGKRSAMVRTVNDIGGEDNALAYIEYCMEKGVEWLLNFGWYDVDTYVLRCKSALNRWMADAGLVTPSDPGNQGGVMSPREREKQRRLQRGESANAGEKIDWIQS